MQSPNAVNLQSGEQQQQQQQHDLIAQLKQENESLKNERNEAIESIKILHNQQCDLYKSFKLLRSKYDDLKTEIQHILWEFIPSQHCHKEVHDGFSELGNVNLSVFESPNRISHYMIGPILGEGQFANVKLCINTVTQKQYAVKVINKKQVTTLAGLKRVQNEVQLLKQLDHPNIVNFVDFIHSTKNIYIFTQVGGKDLFEFFEANPLGVTDETARQIIIGIVKPLLYLHQSGICHRDLKPENILLSEKKKGLELHHSVQLCDFGHSVISSSKNRHEVSGLCGSPGFFAPEMILQGSEKYDGFAADVWSIGCVMLELTRGHDEFCRIWMTSYDYEILQNEEQFGYSLNKAVTEVHKKCAQNEFKVGGSELDMFLKSVLVVDPIRRLKTSEMLQHPWLNHKNELPLHINSYCADTIQTSQQEDDSSLSSGRSSGSEPTKTSQSKSKRNLFRNSFSSRARKHFAGPVKVRARIATGDNVNNSYNDVEVTSTNKEYEHIELRLPPVEPETPSSKAMKRKMLEGKKITNKVTVAMKT